MAPSSLRHGKNVFILGAGASVHTQAPLMTNFIPRARALFAESNGERRFDDVFRVIDELRASSYYTSVNLDNIEDVFSIVHLAREAGLQGYAQVYDSLVCLIAETVERCCLLSTSGGVFGASAVYDLFVQTLKKVVGLSEERRPCSVTDSDAIITFNYDFMLDYAMRCNHLLPDYGVGEVQDERYVAEKWPLLKLHGSVNWGVHPGCPGTAPLSIAVWPPRDNSPGQLLEAPGPHQQLALLISSAPDHLRRMPCPSCDERGVLRPVIVPPTWAKSPSESRVGPVWRRAVEVLSEATQVFIIGYSLPATDTVFSYLMALGLQHNRGLRRVVVANPDEETKARYEEVFSRDLARRDSLAFWPVSFHDFIWRIRDETEKELHYADATS